VDGLARKLEELIRAGVHLNESERRLVNFDADRYRQAAARMVNGRRHRELAEALNPASAKLDLAQAEWRVHKKQLLSLACCEATDRETEIQQNLADVDAALAAHQESSLMARSRRPGLRSKLTASRANLAGELASAAADRRRTFDAARQAGADPMPAVRPDTAETAAAAERARKNLAGAAGNLQRLKEEIGRLAQAGLPGSSDEDLVTTEQQRWSLYEELPELRRRAREATHRRPAVQREYDEASKRLREQKPLIELEIISGARLVATTLAQLTFRQAITHAAFDHVIIDEAAAAQLPHLAHAVGYARTGAVLVGDYLQNGPIVEKTFPGGSEAQKLFKTDCFSFFGATDPKQAQRTEGCVVLTEQFRFGPALTELANRVAYRGILTTAGRGEADIVVITTDGLPEDIRTIHRERKQAGWWLIGALMARALAEYHNDSGAGDAFGVVVPYTDQERATQAALDDSSLARATPVGTSHKFQGRQFGTVLVDLVEDGDGRMANASLQGGDYAADSIRLFNVAATRLRSRLYVLVGRRVLEQARSGPLEALRSMVSAGQATRVDADALLGMFGADPPPPDTPEADLVSALSPFVRVAGIHDEDAAIDEVIARIDEAHRSIWCWSAWVGRYAEDLIDALERAHQRGVSVHVIARPEAEVQRANQTSLRNLVARLPRVVFMQRMHQKIVVVDQQWSIVGSMNMLSHGQTSAKRIRDVMFTMDGTRFANEILQQELAAELGQQRQCQACGQDLLECGLVGSGSDRGWAWICAANRGHRLRFPRSDAYGSQRRNAGRRS
jgi:hypothetical protein